MADEDPLLPPESAPCPPCPDEYNFVAEPMLGPSGLKLMTYSWTKRKAPKGIVVLCHGYGVHQTFTWYLATAPGGEHVVFKDSIVQRLCDAGYAVRGIDHQGHGRSESARGLRCYFDSFEDLVDENMAYVRQVMAEPINAKRRLPIFLFGESMGG